MSALIIKQGILDTIQDHGRYGFQHNGINPGGAMDNIAASIANILVGNNPTAPVFELHFPASSFKFTKASLIALSGGDFTATINDENIPLNTTILVAKDAVLKFIKPVKGTRCYLAISGGWKANNWLNSYSTHLKIALGGYEGRALKKGDIVESIFTVTTIKAELLNASYKSLGTTIDTSSFYNSTNKIRCTIGAEINWLTEQAKLDLFTSAYFISNKSDRMGFQMEGPVLPTVKAGSLLSSAVTKGTIQLLPSGKLIVLMADHQTTGGYPKVAHVIIADIPTLAQKAVNENTGFKLIDQQEAEDLLVDQQERLNNIELHVHQHLKPFMNNL